MRKHYHIYDILRDFINEPLDFEFSDNTTLEFNAADFSKYYEREMLNVVGIVNDEVKELGNWDSFKAQFANWNNRKDSNFTRIKDALALEYDVLDNYNGSISSTMTDTFNKDNTLSFTNRLDTHTLNHSDALTFANRLDTQTFNNSDTLSFTNREDTQTHNTNERTESDPNSPKTTTTATNKHETVTHYVTGYNSSTPAIASEDVTIADATGQGGGALNDSEVVESGAMDLKTTGTVKNAKAGSETNSHSGTITDAKAGSETTTHSGTITDAKSGSETDEERGTITHVYSETKSGNLGVTTSQQMLESELDLRMKASLKDIMVKDFLMEYAYY